MLLLLLCMLIRISNVDVFNVFNVDFDFQAQFIRSAERGLFESNNDFFVAVIPER